MTSDDRTTPSPAGATTPAPANAAANPASGERLSRAVITGPLGGLTLIVSDVGLRALLWPDEPVGRVPSAGLATEQRDRDIVDPRHRPLIDDARDQIEEYFAGTRLVFDLPLDPVGTPFQCEVWNVLRSIPYGATMSYGEQARQLGDVNKARAVGAANGRNPISIIVPCHRVVGSNGSLTGFAGGVEAKRWLLDHERRVSGRTLC
ncbi:MAG: methylated-DNA--[protein]-cysteine S-methyltransferase [Ilumatobacter sp.]|uniref:methylated-DNA--[protein]-cysteine S-methyltransferase n=1 Tax=Ilumatobacter sp. TaxID=1967498 RepID=UPI00391BCF05